MTMHPATPSLQPHPPNTAPGSTTIADLGKFAETLETVYIATVEEGHMTKDFALLIGPDQAWLTTMGFLDKVNENLEKAMSAQTARTEIGGTSRPLSGPLGPLGAGFLLRLNQTRHIFRQARVHDHLKYCPIHHGKLGT